MNDTNNNHGIYPIHAAAHLFPRMTTDEFEQLKADIAAHGQQAPILLHEGQVVDGRHRLRACAELGIAPRFEEIEASNQPIEQVVVSINLHRRHLTDGQKAVIAARIANLKLGSNQHTAGAVSQKQAADELGISVDTLQRGKQVLEKGAPELIQAVEEGRIDISNAARISKLDRDEQVRLSQQDIQLILKTSKEINRAKIEERRRERLTQIEQKRKKNRPLDTDVKYELIYADPPWNYMSELAVGYPCMSVDEICKMEVDNLATEDAVLFMWTSASLLKDALDVIEAWGFTFRTSAVWDKGSPGQGRYFRQGHEVLMVATRGAVPDVPLNAIPESVLRFPRGKHSEKPKEMYGIIDAMYPELTKMELFCRGTPPEGWEGWGNEYVPRNTEQQGNAGVEVLPQAA
ncbi:MAG: MT-A70 family methyltransferase [Betaproteobacteria bacterium]|nr:MT-A70 family methyltransferase [Betaproteobacteria bacterium]